MTETGNERCHITEIECENETCVEIEELHGETLIEMAES